VTIGLLAIEIFVHSVVQPCAASAQTSPPSKARDQLNKGVEAFKNAQYPAAVEHFTTAVQLDPNLTDARLYLATAYMQQYIPGADSLDNMKVANEALDQFQIVLERDPLNESAVASVAALYFNEKKFDDAEQWYQKLISVNPSNKEAYYTLGVIAWTKAFHSRTDDRGPLTGHNVRAELAAANAPLVEEGIKNLDAAIRLDPEYDDAMAYENLLYREKADLEDAPEAYRADIEAADNFFAKTIEIRKLKADRNASSDQD
jgi:tetratricopeptide (TPR) repeat protein